MVTQFNSKDMTSFTNYVLNLVQTGQKQSHEVTHADFENWKLSKMKDQVVRAKFICDNSDSESDDNDTCNIHLSVVIEGSAENKEFSKYTPYGGINIGIDKDSKALELFERGREYYVDFRLA